MTDAITATQRLVRFKQACSELGMSTDSGYAHVRAGTFPVPTVKVGSILKVRRTDLDQFLAGPTAAE